MGEVILVIICHFLIPLTMIIVGAVWIKHPPKEINSLSGYRTPMSMQNKDTWNFAHRFCGVVLLICGIILLAVSIFIVIWAAKKTDMSIQKVGIILMVIQSATFILSIIPTEIALGIKFDKDGNRRKPELQK